VWNYAAGLLSSAVVSFCSTYNVTETPTLINQIILKLIGRVLIFKEHKSVASLKIY